MSPCEVAAPSVACCAGAPWPAPDQGDGEGGHFLLCTVAYSRGRHKVKMPILQRLELKVSDRNGTFVAFGAAEDRETVALVFVVAPRFLGLKCH